MSLKSVFLTALDQRLQDPRGPVAFVPDSVKDLVRCYVAVTAKETLTVLRERESREGTDRYRYRWGART